MSKMARQTLAFAQAEKWFQVPSHQMPALLKLWRDNEQNVKTVYELVFGEKTSALQPCAPVAVRVIGQALRTISELEDICVLLTNRVCLATSRESCIAHQKRLRAALDAPIDLSRKRRHARAVLQDKSLKEQLSLCRCMASTLRQMV